MKSAKVCLPGSSLNLQITPNGLLNAISMKSDVPRPASPGSSQAAFDQIPRHGGARHRCNAAAALAAAMRPALVGRLEPHPHVFLEADAVHVVIEGLAQARAQGVV